MCSGKGVKLVPLSLALLLTGSLFAGIVPGRYIVELSTEPVVEHLGKQARRQSVPGSEAAAHRARVRSEQRDLRERLPPGVTVLDSVDTVSNAMFVEMTAGEAKQVAATAGVRRVRPVRTLHMVLDRAVEVAGVVDAWNQLPAGTAGAGVKVAIIDSGIEAGHPGFQVASLQPPAGFPKVTNDSDRALTNGKVIVARSYVSMLPHRDSDRSAQDRVGHGTALAMVVAGVRTAGPLATISGVAPKAWLGNYKVFGSPGMNDETTDDAVLKALDDAIADGMDIVNLSLGYDLAPRLADDPQVEAIERATKAGVIVVVAAGNNGPNPGTIASPATAPSAIAVGASHNDRTFAASAEISGSGTFVAVNAESTPDLGSVSGTMMDVAAVDATGLACSSLPAGSAAGRIVLIRRGTCTFEGKLNNAQQAGATGALVYATEADPDPFVMGTSAATLPAQMVSNADGLTIKAALLAGAPAAVLRFARGPVASDPNRLAGFSAAGPDVDASVKPDLVAVGVDLYVATETLDSRGDMYDASGFRLVDGTSFSAPMVAGAAALLKSARPGLTMDQYRSLLINTASTVTGTMQQRGAGRLNAGAALRATATAYPTALNFGSGGANPDMDRTLRVTNAGTAAETFTVLVDASRGVSPVAAIATIEIAAGGTADVPVRWQAASLTEGAYEGFVRVTGTSSGTEIRVPWWYGVTSGTPAGITILSTLDRARRNSANEDAILFRVNDAAGLPIVSPEIRVVMESGNGEVQSVRSLDSDVPGLYSANLRLGPSAGPNVFRIEARDVSAEVTITGN